MKIVPILAITNALALGAAALLYLEIDDLKSQVGSSRGSSRAASGSDEVDTQGYTQAQLDRAVERALTRRGPEGAARSKLDASGDEPIEEGKAIDRSLPSPENFDEDAEREKPGMDYFRQRVRLAQDLNGKEDRIVREVERIDQLIDSARIGSLSPVQKKKAAEVLIQRADKTRLIWRGLREREDLKNVPQDQRREAYGNAYREEAETLRAETQKSLEKVIPAADAATLLESGRGDMGFSGRRRGR